MIRVKKENHRSWFMSNYYPCEFVMNGIRYKNAEAAFQSHKVPLEERRQFADMPPASAKRFGRNVAIPANWDEARDDVMRRVVVAANTAANHLTAFRTIHCTISPRSFAYFGSHIMK